MKISEMQSDAHQNSRAHGFWPPEENATHPTTIAAKLALVHSEVSEALEAVRETGTDSWIAAGREDDKNNKPMGLGPELADILIRVGDLAEALHIDLEHWVTAKMAFNKSRPFKHNKAI